MHPTKRRRIGLATATPNRPFRSPLRVDQGKCNASADIQDDEALQSLESVTPVDLSHPNKPSASKISTTAQDASKPSRDLPRLTDRNKLSSETTSTHQLASTSQDYATLQRQYRSLSLQLRELTKALDTVTQALKIAQSDEDSKLDSQIKKWQAISREAAEDLFSTAAERVRQMGGFGAWRDQCSRSRQEHYWGGDEGADENLLSEEQKEQLEIAREEAQTESEKYLQPPDGRTVNEDDNDSFTMGTMLRQLNIDPEVIGYDMKTQAWIE